jgi:hypothetical protein
VSLLFLGLFYHFNDFSCFTPAAAHLKSAKYAKSQIVSQSIAFEDSSSIYLFRTKKKSNMKIIISLGDYMRSKISFSKKKWTLLHHVAANKDQSKVYKSLMGVTEEKNPKVNIS